MFSLHQKYLFQIKKKTQKNSPCSYFYLKNTFKRVGWSQAEIELNGSGSILGDGNRLAGALFIA